MLTPHYFVFLSVGLNGHAQSVDEKKEQMDVVNWVQLNPLAREKSLKVVGE